MYWQEPNESTLYLPLSLGDPFLDIKKCKVNDIYKTAVNSSFRKCWTNPNISNPDAICNELIVLLKACAGLILIAQQTIENYEKTSKQDLVTQADIGVEKIIRFWFEKFLPNHIIIGEEMHKPKIKHSDIVWYLDPIDGTSNYTKQSKEFCINLGSTFNGKPFINLIYYPTAHTYYYQTPTKTNYKFISPKENLICSEFYPNRVLEEKVFNSILNKTGYNPFKTCALGVSLLKMIEGKISAFYKLNVKPWDIMSGAGILATSDKWDISLLLHDNTQICPFSNSKDIVKYFNSRFLDNCRIGTLIITLKDQPQIKEVILSEALNP